MPSFELSDEETTLIKLCLARCGYTFPAYVIQSWTDQEIQSALDWTYASMRGDRSEPCGCIMRALASHGKEYRLVVDGEDVMPYQRTSVKKISKERFQPATLWVPDACDEGMGCGKYNIMRIVVNGVECLSTAVDASSFFPSATVYPNGYPLPTIEDGHEVELEVISQLPMPCYFRAVIPGRIVRRG